MNSSNDLNKRKEILIRHMVAEGSLRTKEIIAAFRKVRREDFVPAGYRKYAYADEPLPLLAGQTISQPTTVAIMTEALAPAKGNKILEVGAGSGYQAAILSETVGSNGKVITCEIKEDLFRLAKANLEKYKNVRVLHYDASHGYEEEAPYDRIIVTASAPRMPDELEGQLKDGGRLVIPVGSEMFLVAKEKEKIQRTFLGYFAFVPLTGRASE